MAYYVGDIPIGEFIIEPPDSVEADRYSTSTATVISPSGTTQVIPSYVHSNGSIRVGPATESPFDVPGIYIFRITLTDAGSAYIQLPDARIVAQDADASWHNLDSIREDWADADNIADGTLFDLLEVARKDVTAYGPSLGEPEPAVIPTNYLVAQRMQTRNIWNANKVSPDGGIGEGDFIIRPFPLDWQIKQLLRPRRGTPVIG